MQDEDDEWRRNNDDDKVFILVKVFYWLTDTFLNFHMYSWDTLSEISVKSLLDALPYAVISGILVILMIIFEINRVLEKKKEKKYKSVNMGQQILESIATIILPLLFIPWGAWFGAY